MALLSGGEIVDMAIEMERIGAKFYAALAEHASDDEARAMFQWLASEERDHERNFEKLREHTSSYTLPESYPGEWQAYVRALIESRTILGDEDINRLAASTNFVEALKIGVALEKDSIIFYEALKEYVPEGERGVVEDIISQERGHLRRLADVLMEFQS
ncbi:MAG: ferritin family protein [Armatimonadota bacterium]|nr:ferritin family protein [Armatimonadota bacterium]MCX7777558.1 ferritin family protein [Armatimonadota bacterium]MDW8025567.1 ferritin family protein [Armatimonadota bacterium]